jgi:hypothetical protein
MVLTALSLEKGNEFERSPAIQGPISNSRNLSAFHLSTKKRSVYYYLLVALNAHLLNRHIFGNGRKKDV